MKEGTSNLLLLCLMWTCDLLDPFIPAGCTVGKCSRVTWIFSLSSLFPLFNTSLPPPHPHVCPTRGLHLQSVIPLHLPPRAHSSPLNLAPSPSPPLTPSVGARLWPLLAAPSPPLSLTAVVSEGQMTGELAPGRAPSHPGAIRLVANNRCFRPGEDQSGGIMGNVQSAAFYTSAQMDEITLVSF